MILPLLASPCLSLVGLVLLSRLPLVSDVSWMLNGKWGNRATKRQNTDRSMCKSESGGKGRETDTSGVCLICLTSVVCVR